MPERLAVYRDSFSENMARCKPQDRNSPLLPLVLSGQIVPSSFAFALNYLIDQDLTVKPLDAQFKNDEAGVGACDPRTG